MKKRISSVANLVYYLLVLAVVVGLAWAYLMPAEISVIGRGAVAFTGPPAAVTAPGNCIISKIFTRTMQPVKEGQALISVSPFEKETANTTEVTINSREDGIIVWQKDMVRGDLINLGERLGLIHPASPVGFKVFFPDKELSRIRVGMPVRIALDAYPNRKFGTLRGEVKEVILEPSLANGQKYNQLVVTIEIKDIPEGVQILPGLTGNAELISGRTRLLRKILF